MIQRITFLFRISFRFKIVTFHAAVFYVKYMSNKSGTSSQVISLPKGGGALSGLGEKFSPDLFTGTGNFTVPIALPPGRNGFQPNLSLMYSTGNGNGAFGLGWSLSIPGVTRKTSKGIPRYYDNPNDPLLKPDVFILSGAEDLVPVEGAPSGAQRYRPRTEGLFALIDHFRDDTNDYWRVQSKDGLICYYGTEASAGADPAVIAKSDEREKVFAWKLSRTEDPFSNRIEYEYSRDQGDASTPEWDQLYLKQIRYVDYTDSAGQTQYLATIDFVYDNEQAPPGAGAAVERPDPFSEYRSGFEIRTRRRCKWIVVKTHPADITGQHVRAYEFVYLDERAELPELADLLPLNNASLLSQVKVIGYDDSNQPARELPPLEFGYSRFEPENRKFAAITGADLPSNSLAHPDLELVDLFGNGLPDVLEMNGVFRYWRNLGNGSLALPRMMNDAPAGVRLADPGVQMIDANGDGRADLLVTTETMAGYYPLCFNGLWDRKSFQRYKVAPSFNLEDPEVKLVDLDGDGVTDVIRSGSRMECFFNDAKEGWNGGTRWVERKPLEEFPNVNFSDPRVKWGEMSGDGLQDILLVYDRNVEYWPSFGHGDWGKRIHMENSPHFPYGYDPRRILIGDVDGDGRADMVYVDDTKVTLWINQSGNRWSDPIVIQGTPPITDMDAVRLVDMFGTGVSGILWSSDAQGNGRPHMYFLDFTGGAKPYLLHEMDNHMGAVTKVRYAPSTHEYLRDQAKPATRWRTPLPFPVQVVAGVEVIDEISKGKLTTEYRYHHGYWDGAEREFRGFGMVEQRDTQVITKYNTTGLHGADAAFDTVETHFSPPTLSKTWFHQGPIGEEFGDWQEQDWSDQYWNGDPQLLNHTESVNDFLKTLAVRRVKRDALRTLRGSILRTELYALDGTNRESRPYTVTEHAYGLREEQVPADPASSREHIFFPHSTSQRTTQWERGDDPMTQFSFTDKYDAYGQPLSQTGIAMPRRSNKRIALASGEVVDESGMLVTHARTAYAEPAVVRYICDRAAHATSFTLSDKPEVTETASADVIAVLKDQKDTALAVHFQIETALESWEPEQGEPYGYRIINHSVNYYDGVAYIGEPIVGQLGQYGAVTRSESLVFTDDMLDTAYGSLRPGYLDGSASLPAGAPTDFGVNHGYLDKRGSVTGYVPGYYVASQQKKFDFQAGTANPRGLMVGMRDPLGNESKIIAYAYDLLPLSVKDPIGLEIHAEYNYRVLQPFKVTEPNGNYSKVNFSPMGLVTSTWIKGKNSEGDQTFPSARLEYDFLAFANSKAIDPDIPEPVYVHTIRRCHHDGETDVDSAERDRTIESREYSDGFGRLIQTRTQGEEVRFGDSTFGGGEEVLPANQADGRGGAVIGQENTSTTDMNVIVSGWQVYDNKGRVVEKYEPFFDVGWEFQREADAKLGEHASMFYDPRGQVIRTENPDGSEQRVIYGVPVSLDNPFSFTPTPWEAYTYDANDNAGRTHPSDSNCYRHHYNTPASILIDAMGRTLMAVERNRDKPATSMIEEYRTRSTYDIQGNLITVIDALGREVFTHVYDLAKRPLKIHSIDAGDRCMVPNAANSEIERRDSKGAVTLRAFDELIRPTHVWAKNDASASSLTLREKLVYGDDPASGFTTADVATGNILGRLYQYYDEAGLLTFAAYDFKGNPLEKQREVIADGDILAALDTGSGPVRTFVVDWDAAPPALEGNFQTSIAYDALNRVKSMRYPEDVDGNRKALTPFYNRAGALESVKLDTATYVERIAYNAKGQRILIAYGNKVMTRHAYYAKTFRLMRMRTEKYSTQLSTPLTYSPNGGLLQDFAYEYDLAGNILRITDIVPGSGVRNNPEAGLFPDLETVLSAGDALLRRFEYDPLYRLTSATGRESQNIGRPRTTEDMAREGFNWGAPGTPSPENARDLTEVYTETYEYDPAGNMLALKHSDWTRHFGMAGFTPKQWKDKVSAFLAGGTSAWGMEGNRLTNFGTNEDQIRSHTFDNNGNLTQEFTNRRFAWDYSDRMISFADRPTLGSPASAEAIYLYDAGGQRIKKLVHKQAGEVATITYIDGIFEHHVSDGQENNTLHVMDNTSRIALVHVGSPFPDDGAPSITVKYQLGDHLGSSSVVIGGDTATGNSFINREEYFPYGETSFGSFGRKRYRYTGKERDEESGLYYHGTRYYAPWLGSWVNCDPLGMVDGVNLYQSFRSNPLRFVDDSGTKSGEVSKWEASDEEGLTITADKVNNASSDAPQTLEEDNVEPATAVSPSVTKSEQGFEEEAQAYRHEGSSTQTTGGFLKLDRYEMATKKYPMPYFDEKLLIFGLDLTGNSAVRIDDTVITIHIDSIFPLSMYDTYYDASLDTMGLDLRPYDQRRTYRGSPNQNKPLEKAYLSGGEFRKIGEGIVGFAAIQGLVEVGVANVFGQLGATFGEVGGVGQLQLLDYCTGGRILQNNSSLQDNTLWGLVQTGFNRAYKVEWEHAFGSTDHGKD